MRGNNRFTRNLHDIPEALVIEMTDINKDAKSFRFLDQADTKRGQTSLLPFPGIFKKGTVSNIVAAAPYQSKPSESQLIEDTQQVDIVLQRVCSFEREKNRDFSCVFGKQSFPG